MPIQGDLRAMPVPELLMWISQFQKNGTLEIRAGEFTETMAFENGSLVFSSSSNPERTEWISEEIHTRARELRETKSVAVAKALLFSELTLRMDEKGEYHFDATGIRLDIPTDI